MPFPLYGSGFFIERTSAQNCPTLSLSALDIVTIFFSITTVIPSGIFTKTGCEKPTWSFKSFPAISTRYPMPSTCNFFTNGWLTPAIILRTCAAYVPQSARESREEPFGSTRTLPLSTLTETAGCTLRESVPPFPFTVISLVETDTSVPPGTAIGLFPIRRIQLPNFEKGFAADLFFTCFFIRHDALGGREDEIAVTVSYRTYLAHRPIHTTPWLRNALDAHDSSATRIVVLENDIERLFHFLPLFLDRCKIAGFLESLCDCHFECGKRHRNCLFFHVAGILKAVYEISNWVCSHGIVLSF